MVVWEVAHAAEGLEGDWAGGPEEGRAGGLVGAQGAGDEALGPGSLQAFQEASRTEGRLETVEHFLWVTH